MPAGTIKLTNNSTAVTGTGTSFSNELAASDFLVVVVGGVTYTLGVKSVESNTGLTLLAAYNGPTTTGLSWTPVPNATLVGITAQVAADVAKAIRGMNLDKNNWQQVFSGTGNITVTLPDGSQFTGPAWSAITTLLNNKAAKGDNNDITSLSALSTAISIAQGGTGKKTASEALAALGGFSSGGGAINGDVSLNGTFNKLNTNTVNRMEGNLTIPSLSQNALTLWNTTPTTQNVWLNFYRTEGLNGWRMGRQDGGSFVLACDQVGSTAMVLGVNDKIYTTANTTRAADGTLKAASPVARITKSQEENKRTDIDEQDFEWCGAGTRNAEAAGITITRMDVGVYVLAGSLGLAKEGWQLSPPRDPMGSGDMGIVEAEETESGGITVRLYKRKYMLSDDGEIVLTKGPLIDVPPTSWIDIRLQMPEKESSQEESPGSDE